MVHEDANRKLVAIDFTDRAKRLVAEMNCWPGNDEIRKAALLLQSWHDEDAAILKTVK